MSEEDFDPTTLEDAEKEVFGDDEQEEPQPEPEKKGEKEEQKQEEKPEEKPEPESKEEPKEQPKEEPEKEEQKEEPKEDQKEDLFDDKDTKETTEVPVPTGASTEEEPEPEPPAPEPEPEPPKPEPKKEPKPEPAPEPEKKEDKKEPKEPKAKEKKKEKKKEQKKEEKKPGEKPEPGEKEESEGKEEAKAAPTEPGAEHLYAIRTTVGKEATVAEFLSNRAKMEKLELSSFVVPSSLKGYILVETPAREELVKAVTGIQHIRGIISGEVDFSEITHYLEAKVVKDIPEKALVELVSGPFKGEKAKVVRVDKSKDAITVELIEATVPIPITVKMDAVRVLAKDTAVLQEADITTRDKEE